jgi:competence protein ComGF
MVALMVLAGSVLLCEALVSQIKTEQRNWAMIDEKEWATFVKLVDTELKKSTMKQCSPTELQYDLREFGKTKSTTMKIFYVSDKKEIQRRVVGSAGFQPLLENVQTVNFQQVGDKFVLQVTFVSGKEFSARWHWRQTEEKKVENETT